MRITLVFSLFVVYFLHSEAASMEDMLPKMSDLIAMKEMKDSLKGIMKPFGCMDLRPSKEFVTPCIECMKEIGKEFRDETIKTKTFELPSFKDALERFTQCRLEKYNLIENGKFSIDNYKAFHKSVTYEKSNSKDLDLLNEIIDKCIAEVKVDDKSAIKGAMALEKCVFRDTIDRCSMERGADSVGVLLPTMYALNSLYDENTACDKVTANEQTMEEYKECVVENEGSSSSEEERSVFPNPMKNVMKIFNCFKEIPEIECLKEIAEVKGLRKDGKADFQAMANYIGDLTDWGSEELKKKVTGTIEQCGTVEASVDWKRDVEFGTCFLPAFADICGLDNQLSRDVLFPMLNEKFLSSILNRINEKFDLIGLMEMIPV